jgi:excisionase family DNA binding protein
VLPPREQALAYTLDEAARLCGVSRDTMYRAVKSGMLRAKRTSRDELGDPVGKILILRKDLEAWLEDLPDDWYGLKSYGRL